MSVWTNGQFWSGVFISFLGLWISVVVIGSTIGKIIRQVGENRVNLARVTEGDCDCDAYCWTEREHIGRIVKDGELLSVTDDQEEEDLAGADLRLVPNEEVSYVQRTEERPDNA